jgi:hypothetical protein
MPKKPNNDSPSGCSDNPPSSCPPHHWKLGSTEHVHVPGEGLTNIGQTEGVCQRCGATKTWEAPTPDNVHGMDSHILAEMAGAPLPEFEEDTGHED